MIKKIMKPMLTLVLGVSIVSPFAHAADSDVVAKVEDQTITVEEMKDIVTSLVQQQGQNVPPAQMSQIQQQQYQMALDRLIDISLLEQAAQDEKIEVTDAEIDAEINKVKANLPNPDMLDQLLQRGGKTMAGLREEIRKEKTIKKVIDKNVPAGNPVTEAEAKAFFDENPEQFSQAEQIRASHILLEVPENATPEQDKEVKDKIEKIRQDILNNEITFGEAAKQHSSCPSSANEGDLDFFTRGRMVPEFEQAAFSLEKGEFSEPVKTQFGYHLIKVTDTKQSYEDFKSDIISFLETKQKGENTNKYIDELKEKAEIEILMTEDDWKKEFASAQNQQNMQLQIPQGALQNPNNN